MKYTEETRKRLEEITKKDAGPNITDPDQYDLDIQCIAAALAELDRVNARIERIQAEVGECFGVEELRGDDLIAYLSEQAQAQGLLVGQRDTAEAESEKRAERIKALGVALLEIESQTAGHADEFSANVFRIARAALFAPDAQAKGE